MDIAFKALVFLVGLTGFVLVMFSVIRTFMLPRSARDRITRVVFRNVRRVFDFFVRRSSSYLRRDKIMALYVPITLLILLVTWLVLVQLSFACMYYAVGITEPDKAFMVSGSSLLTLGFAAVGDFTTEALAFTEAITGLILVALLIAYLPTIYSAFSKRELAVTMLEVRAGSPPSPVEMIKRFHRLGRFDKLNELWVSWELWFVELSETHTSFAMLPFFRSPLPEHSWITAAGAVLDAAALMNSTVASPPDAQADLCIRAGFLALRRIADYFRFNYNPRPNRYDPISISRDEFYEAYEELARAEVPLKPDREQAWEDFAGWRVNYDTVLVRLAGLVMAPPAMWSSDRSLLPTQSNLQQKKAGNIGSVLLRKFKF